MVVGKIIELRIIPILELHIVKVDIGTEYRMCMWCPQLFEGAVVPFAKLGGRVGDLEIKEVSIAGVVSRGMCCSKRNWE